MSAAEPRGGEPAPGQTRILVIRLGALGDFVLSLGAFAAIRRHHAGAWIELLTTAPFVELARASGLFDRVRVDRRPPWWRVADVMALRRYLRGGFARIYDLQTSSRTTRYFGLLRPGPRPEWSGVARGASHPDDNPERGRIHTIERQCAQLCRAGIDEVPFPDLGFAASRPLAPEVPARFALLVPGAAPHRPEKRWPPERFGRMARRLVRSGVAPVIVGTAAEAAAARLIRRIAPEAVDLVGRTSLLDLPALGARAALALGNDTGPMHVFAIAGAPAVVLFSAASDPARTAPRAPPGAPPVAVLAAPDLADLSVDTVWAAVEPLVRAGSDLEPAGSAP